MSALGWAARWAATRASRGVWLAGPWAKGCMERAASARTRRPSGRAGAGAAALPDPGTGAVSGAARSTSDPTRHLIQGRRRRAGAGPRESYGNGARQTVSSAILSFPSYHSCGKNLGRTDDTWGHVVNTDEERRTAFVDLELAAVWQGHERGV